MSARDALAGHGVVPERLLATPTPFNTLFWKAIAIDGGRYINLYIPVLGGEAGVTAYLHLRGEALTACLGDRRSLDKLAAFSKGFYRIERIGDDVVVSDLRMGLTPDYAFRFAIARDSAGELRAIPPSRRESERGGPADLDWLISSLSGDYGLRAAETQSSLSPTMSWMVASSQPETRIC